MTRHSAPSESENEHLQAKRGEGWVRVDAPAKINLALRIRGRTPTGYHRLQSIIAPVSLADTVSVRWSDQPVSDQAVVCTTELSRELQRHVDVCRIREPEVDRTVAGLSSAENLAARAAQALLLRAGGAGVVTGFQLELHVLKRIPFGAGLGGGSADAAATLHAVNCLLPHPLALCELAEIAAELGSDVTALLHRGPTYVWDLGESVVPLRASGPESPLANLVRSNAVIVKPPCSVKTGEAYALLGRGLDTGQDLGPADPLGRELLERFGALPSDGEATPGLADNHLTLLPQAGICQGPESGWWERSLGALFNDFHEVITRHEPSVSAVMQALGGLGATRVLLAGSGSSCVAWMPTSESALPLAERLTGDATGWFVAPFGFLGAGKDDLKS